MSSNNYFQGSTLNVSPLCQGCKLIIFAHQNGIMFHECELCKNKYQEMLAKQEYKEQLDWDYHAHENLHKE